MQFLAHWVRNICYMSIKTQSIIQVSLFIQSKYRKVRTRITLNTDNFYAVFVITFTFQIRNELPKELDKINLF